MKVGIFDSGVGGITVLKEALDKLPHLEYIYYSDNINVPYGTKPKEEVLGYIHHVMDFLISQNVEAIVIACNTATSIAVSELRACYSIPIIGMEPAVKLALDSTQEGRVLVTATALTLKEEKYRKLINSFSEKDRVDSLALPELVTYAENFVFDEEVIIPYFKEKFAQYDLSQYTGLVLGCTHFVYFKKLLRNILPSHIALYDGNEGTIRHLKELIENNKLGQEEQGLGKNKLSHVDFYYSAQKDVENKILKKYLYIL